MWPAAMPEQAKLPTKLMLALTSNKGLTAAQVQEWLNAIADVIRLRDVVRAVAL